FSGAKLTTAADFMELKSYISPRRSFHDKDYVKCG
ncbi:MAG: hypothetical protein JWO08_3848, partial [Verrucomicrobiaceae bacterium]|nr:hypothetical protein [Verrucomicrobiaceae bacterium]